MERIPRSGGPKALDDVCPVCEGLGWVIREDGGAGSAERCDCARRERAQQYLAFAGIPEGYQDCRLDTFKTHNSNAAVRKTLAKALRICQQYVADFYDAESGEYTKTGLLFRGRPGAGKTHLATAVLSEVVQRYQVKGRFVGFTDLMLRLQSTFDSDSPETRRAVLQPVIEADFLVLDELGARRSSDWMMDILYHIINSRYTAQRPTLFTTNYRLENLETVEQAKRSLEKEIPFNSDKHAMESQSGKYLMSNQKRDGETQAENLAYWIGPQLLSRLKEMTVTVHMDVTDYRLQKTPRHVLAKR